jgi:uncharacterized protein
MSRVFLDTVGLLAVWNRRDQWHGVAKPVFTALMKRDTDFLTTPGVLLECGNASARQPFRPLVGELRQRLRESGTLIEPTPNELEDAWLAYLRGEAGDAGIVDQISFAIMRRLGLTEAFTNDRHFQAAGFTLLF